MGKLPLTGWCEVIIPVQQTGLTSLVSIHVTGHGDIARTLRILGYYNSVQGYYEKRFADISTAEIPWTFYPLVQPLLHPIHTIPYRHDLPKLRF